MKRILSVILTLCMIVTLMPATVITADQTEEKSAASGEGEHTHEEWTPIGTSNDLVALFNEGGHGYLADNITLEIQSSTLSIRESKEVNLCLNGKVLNLNEKNIEVVAGCSLAIYDCAGQGTIKNGCTDYYGGAIYTYGELYLYGGTITECTALARGGAVCVMDDGVFEMYNGTICDCSSSSGGGVDCSAGTFHMYGGSIINNTAIFNTTYTGGYGGGVYNFDAPESFHMHGGSITGNKAEYYGGGVYNIDNISFDGVCIVKDNYSYHGQEMTESNQVRDNVFTASPINLEQENSKEKVIAEGSEIWVTLATMDGREVSAVRVDGLLAQTQTEEEAQYFLSDVDAYYAVYEDSDQEIYLKSRITDQPVPANGHSVSVYDTDQLADPVSYQWMHVNQITETKLSETADYMFADDGGTIDPNDDDAIIAAYVSWEAGEDYEAGSDYEIYLYAPAGTVYVTFTSNNTTMQTYYDEDVLFFDGEKYIFNATDYGKYGFGLTLCDDTVTEPFTIKNVTFVSVKEAEPHDVQGNRLIKRTVGQSYYCTVTFPDGSSVDSEVTTAISEPKEHTHDKGTAKEVVYDRELTDGGTLEGYFFLNQDVELKKDITVAAGKTLNLCLNNHILTGTGTDSVITLEEGAKVYLCDCCKEEMSRYLLDGKCTHGQAVGTECIYCGTCVHHEPVGNYCFECDTVVETPAPETAIAKCDGLYDSVFTGTGEPAAEHVTYTLTGGIIAGGIGKKTNYNNRFGGAVYVGEDAELMLDGVNLVCNNVTVGGGAVYVGYNGTFEMNSGSIRLCSSLNNGGAVFAEGDRGDEVIGLFSMKGGIIEDCTGFVGGDVSLQGGRFEMYQGSTIKGCKASSGGAVDSENGSFHMFGGSITGNHAEFSGGAVYNNMSYDSFHMHGGSITGNSAGGFGGGVYNRRDVSFDGLCTVKDNYAYHRLDVKSENMVRDNVLTTTPMIIGNEFGTETLDAKSEIWVTLATFGDYDIDEVTVTGDITENGMATEKACFRSDADCYYVKYVGTEGEDGHIVLASRIIQQPTKDIGNTVGIYMDGLTKDLGYGDPADAAKDLAYSWKAHGIVGVKLETLSKMPTFICGSVSEDKRSIYTDNKEIDFSAPKGTQYVTFTSDKAIICMSESDSNSYSLSEEDGLYTLKWIGEGPADYFQVDVGNYYEDYITLSDVTFYMMSGIPIGDTDATLSTGAVEDETYYCTVTFKDGTTLDSEDTVFEKTADILTMTISGDTAARHTDVKTYTVKFEGERPANTTVVWDITGGTYEYVGGHIATDSVTIICEDVGTLRVHATLVDSFGRPVTDASGNIVEATLNVTVKAQAGNIINMIASTVKTMTRLLPRWFFWFRK